eukprot:525351-Karenia_brevis.AAC.1
MSKDGLFADHEDVSTAMASCDDQPSKAWRKGSRPRSKHGKKMARANSSCKNEPISDIEVLERSFDHDHHRKHSVA